MKFLATSSENNGVKRVSSVQKVISKMRNKRPITEIQDIRIVESLKEKVNNRLVNFHPKMRIGDVEEIKTLNRTQISNDIFDASIVNSVQNEDDDDMYAASNDSMDNRFGELSDEYPFWSDEEREEEWAEEEDTEEREEQDNDDRIYNNYDEFSVHEFL